MEVQAQRIGSFGYRVNSIAKIQSQRSSQFTHWNLSFGSVSWISFGLWMLTADSDVVSSLPLDLFLSLTVPVAIGVFPFTITDPTTCGD